MHGQKNFCSVRTLDHSPTEPVTTMGSPRSSERRDSGSDAATYTTPDAQSNVLTPAQAARYLCVSLRTLAWWRVQGAGPPFFRLGNGPRGPVRYLRTEVDAFLRRHRFSTTGEVPQESRAAIDRARRARRVRGGA